MRLSLADYRIKPLVSVIVAAYNVEKYIGRCLRSLLNQTASRTDYEIIVVDDGSEDATGYALTLFCDPNGSMVRVITNPNNCGLPAALNTGITASQAKYIVRVDADDFVNRNFVMFLLEYLETNPEADAVACDYLLIDANEKVIRRGDGMEEPIGCGIMFRREQLLELGLYDETFLRHEEKDMRLRFEQKYILKQLSIPLYRYRRHETNITNDLAKMEFHETLLRAKHDK